MDTPAQTPDGLKVAVYRSLALVSVQGRGSFKLAPALKRFAETAMAQGARRLVLDMQACTGMDSTFMGVVAGLAMRFTAEGGHGVVALNLSARAAGLLSQLGVDRLIETSTSAALPEAVRREIPDLAELVTLEQTAGKRVTLETMLRAHEDLIRASPSNQLRFQNVLDYLRQDLGKLEDDRCSTTSS